GQVQHAGIVPASLLCRQTRIAYNARNPPEEYPPMNDTEIKALAISASFDQLRAMVVTLASAVAAADLYLNSYDTSAPSRIKAETRAYVEEAMGLLVATQKGANS